MAVGRFCRNAVGPPEWECEAMGSVVWVQCATSAECINLSIAESTVTDTLESRSHHGSMLNKSCTLSYELCTIVMVGKPSRCSRPSIGRGCDRRKDHEILLVKTTMVVWL